MTIIYCTDIFGWRMQRRGAQHGRLDGVNSCLPIPLFFTVAPAEDSPVSIVILMSRRPYGCWHWSVKKLLCGLKSGLRSAGEPTREDHFHCWSSREQLKDIPSSMNTLTGTYTPASLHDCCHMLKSPQAPLTSDNMTFWLSHCPLCCSHWDRRPSDWQEDENQRKWKHLVLEVLFQLLHLEC